MVLVRMVLKEKAEVDNYKQKIETGKNQKQRTEIETDTDNQQVGKVPAKKVVVDKVQM